MKANEIRASFLEYFKGLNHEVVASAPVAPNDDPTLLFTNAGMNQFKDVFLGTGSRPYSRAADTQKCIRAGGKHNDLDEVGKDGYHQTFFEMLGNWSFGDYFKAEAIEWAWNLLVKEWGVPAERLYATVHHTDEEARELWPKVTGIPRDRVLVFGDKDNFWEMGATGPCGPCTEIHIDRGADMFPDAKGGVNEESERFIELWNLVFIQSERLADGSLKPLPAKHVDTGMGLERVTQVLQGVRSNYDTDLLRPLVDAVVERTGVKYEDGPAGMPHRAIADHVRCLSFAIADGATPDRGGRGYVLRRILRRASRFLYSLGVKEPALSEFVPVLSGYMGEAFPELKQQQTLIERVFKAEEEQFLSTIERGMGLFSMERERLERQGGTVFSGEAAFKLYDTFGFPLDLTEQMAEEQGLTVDTSGYEQEMEETRRRSRKFAKFDVDLGKFAEAGATRFTGYEGTRGGGAVSKAEPQELVLSETPFYAESGGQVGDTGRIVAEDGAFEFEVQDTKRQGQVVVHFGEWIKGGPEVASQGAPVVAEVDAERRARIMRNHTGTHLLHWALREVLGPEATQQGSEVSPGRLRFDFAHGQKVEPEELREIERLINAKIAENAVVETREMSLKEAKDLGAIAMFGEKYSEDVRVIGVGDYSLELCGGTHVARAGDIGLLKIVQEAGVSEGVRRVLALTGGAAVERGYQDSATLARVAQQLKVKPEEVLERIAKLQAEIRELEKRNQEALQAALPSFEQLWEGKEVVHDEVKLLVAEVAGADAKSLRAYGDRVKQLDVPAAALFVATHEGKVPVVAALSKPLVSKGWHSKEWIQSVTKILGGGGGGREALSTGSGRDPSKVGEALKAARSWAESKG